MIINVTDLNDICNICGSSYKWPSASILLDGKRMCVCVCVCFSYKEGDVCEEGCTGLLADPPPGQDQWLLSQAMFFDKRVRVSSDR